MTSLLKPTQGIFRKVGFYLNFAVAGVVLNACLVDTQFSSGPANGEKNSGTTSGSNSGSSVSSTDANGGTGGVEPGEQQQLQCETINGGTCLGEVPFGWGGPIQPQRAKSVDGLAPCKQSSRMFTGRRSAAEAFPDAAKNVFVDRVQAAPASCSSDGCGVDLQTGGCTPMAFVIRRLETESPRKCGEVLPDFSPPFLGASCLQLDPAHLTESGHAIGAIPAQPLLSEASCTATGTSVAEVPVPVFDNFYRICDGEEESTGLCPVGQTCTSFRNRENLGRMSMGCVFKKGDVACPVGPYQSIRLVLFGEAQDDRGCTECQVVHDKGKLECKYGFRVAKNDPGQKCQNSEPVQAEDVCITKDDLLGPNGPYSAFGEYLRVEYSGKCEPKVSEPQGDLKLASPVTLCCSEF